MKRQGVRKAGDPRRRAGVQQRAVGTMAAPESIKATHKPAQGFWLSQVCNVNNMKVNSGGHSKIVLARLIY